MKKRNITIISILLFAVLSITTIIIFREANISVEQQTAFEALTFPVGCTFIENDASPDSVYTETVSANIYTCGQNDPAAAFCKVQGVINIDRSSTSPAIVFRGSSSGYLAGGSTVAFNGTILIKHSRPLNLLLINIPLSFKFSHKNKKNPICTGFAVIFPVTLKLKTSQ
jgi:hypothetical protein